MSQRLANFTSLKLGGPAGRIVEAESEAEIVATVQAADAAGEELLILGGASNVVIADEGFPGTVLLVRNRGVDFGPAPGDPPTGQPGGQAADHLGGGQTQVRSAAGESWDALVASCVERELAGVECLSGIPGSVGATPIQNVGAYGQEVADTIVSVRAYDREAGEIVELTPAECEFGYRDSALKQNPDRWVVLEVTFRLENSAESMPIRYAELASRLDIEVGERAPLSLVRETVRELRRGKGLLAGTDDPESATAGSFFTNPVLSPAEAEALLARAGERTPPLFPQPDGTQKTSAAWLIQNSGFTPGYGDPQGIAISSRHCLVITNRGAGTTSALLQFAHEIAAEVHDRFGVNLRPEPILIGVEW